MAKAANYIRRIEIMSLWNGRHHIVWSLKPDVNILSGSIEEFNAKEVGHLVVKFLGVSEDITRALEWLQAQGVTLQTMAD